MLSLLRCKAARPSYTIDIHFQFVTDATWSDVHSSPTCKMEALLQTRAYFLHKLTRAAEELWTRAVDEQKRLTTQLARNSFYFTISYMLIRFFGDQLAL